MEIASSLFSLPSNINKDAIRRRNLSFMEEGSSARATYARTIDGEGWKEIVELPKIQSVSDFHCAEGWSVLGCNWEGIRFKDLVSLVRRARTTSLSLLELSGDDVLLAYGLNGKPLEEGSGFPLRLVVPSKYGY
jgi:DMSO/TMAO reductase YedYZ molybdopterin-dependent catalytic subunit